MSETGIEEEIVYECSDCGYFVGDGEGVCPVCDGEAELVEKEPDEVLRDISKRHGVSEGRAGNIFRDLQE